MTRFLIYKRSAIWVGCILYCAYVWTLWDLTR
jgi:hypothetical protein